jgi:hypothetical protein
MFNLEPNKLSPVLPYPVSQLDFTGWGSFV